MYWGVDVGSTYTKIVGIDANKNVCYTYTIPAIINQDDIVKETLKKHPVTMLVATGYGRYLLENAFSCPVVSEIKAHARGAYHVFPQTNMVLDLGGQDSKVIKLDGRGGFSDFKMNDKCAAGTGKFLEIAAARLGMEMEAFAQAGFKADKELTISSMCAVFAESELISLIAQKESIANICYGVHDAIASRLSSMARKFSATSEHITFSGGGARNAFLVHLLEKILEKPIYVSQYPQLLGALGAALSGHELA
jgi:predicted CoA-substrate-specific enzyme activase